MSRWGKRIKTRATLGTVVFLLILGGGAFADPFGPPKPEGKDEQISLGVGYYYNAGDWKPSSGNFGNASVSQNQAYLQASFPQYGLSESGAAFLRIGGADFDDGEGFQAGYKLFGTLGFRDVWYDNRRLSFAVGTILTGSYFSGYESEQTFLPGVPVTAKVGSMWNVRLGVAAQHELVKKAFLLYGGPMVVYGTAKVERTVTGSPSESTTYEENDLFGLFAGGRVSIGKRFTFELEGQYRGTFSGGASVSYTF